MKTVLGFCVSGFIFFVGYITFPKEQRVYKEVVWHPTNVSTIPSNNVKQDLSKCVQTIGIYKVKIESNLKVVETMQLENDSLIRISESDTIY